MKDTGSQFPPVGDIKLNKVSGSYNTYKLELSFGQLEVIRTALEAQHAEPIADELLQMFNYYIPNVPGPGEEKEDVEAREQGAEGAEEDFPIPMPPGQETAEGPPAEQGTDQLPELPGEEGGGGGEEEGLPAPPEEGGEEGGGGGGAEPMGGGEEMAMPQGEDEVEEESPEEIADQRLPAPPE